MFNRLTEIGFKNNVHRDAYDCGEYRVYFDDTEMHVIKFTDTSGRQIIEWDSAIDVNMGVDKAMSVIKAMMS